MILVTGGAGYTGRFLVRRLAEGEEHLRCLVRPSSDRKELEQLGVEVAIGDLEEVEEVRHAFAGVRLIFHLAHIRYTRTVVACADSTLECAVLVSSLRYFSRVPSPSVEEVVAGEKCATDSDLPGIILRPSMIYGPGDDRNISRMAAFLRKRRWFPVFGSGMAFQQPVYVEDVVDGILAATNHSCAVGNSYALAGAEALTYDQVVNLVGEAVGVNPVKVHIPVKLALWGAWLTECVGLRTGIEREQILRLQEDKAHSIEAARADLGYRPLALAEGLAEIYGGKGRDG